MLFTTQKKSISHAYLFSVLSDFSGTDRQKTDLRFGFYGQIT